MCKRQKDCLLRRKGKRTHTYLVLTTMYLELCMCNSFNPFENLMRPYYYPILEISKMRYKKVKKLIEAPWRRGPFWFFSPLYTYSPTFCLAYTEMLSKHGQNERINVIQFIRSRTKFQPCCILTQPHGIKVGAFFKKHRIRDSLLIYMWLTGIYVIALCLW